MYKNTKAIGKIGLFGSTRVLVISALFIAMSIVLGKLLAFNVTSYIRISFENLTVLMAGIFFGPLVGAAVGAGADIIGCFVAGYSINPIITLGAASVGLISGLVFSRTSGIRPILRILASAGAAHIIGSMLIKSIGLRVYYGYPLEWLLWRIPVYIGIGLLESYIIHLLTSNRAFAAQLEKARGYGRS